MHTDPYLDHNTCVDRLYKEWKKHPRLIIACDFDDTCMNFHNNEGATHEKVLSLVRRAQALNFYIVMWTASAPERYPFITEYMESKGIHVDSINKNPIELKYGNNGKIYFNHNLCDRSGLKSAYHILDDLIWRINFELKGEKEGMLVEWAADNQIERLEIGNGYPDVREVYLESDQDYARRVFEIKYNEK
jgi:hypothetical protein